MNEFDKAYRKILTEQAVENNDLIGKTVVHRSITFFPYNDDDDDNLLIKDTTDTIVKLDSEFAYIKNNKREEISIKDLTDNTPVSIDIREEKGEWGDYVEVFMVDEQRWPVHWTLQDKAPSIDEMKEKFKEWLTTKIAQIEEETKHRLSRYQEAIKQLNQTN